MRTYVYSRTPGNKKEELSRLLYLNVPKKDILIDAPSDDQQIDAEFKRLKSVLSEGDLVIIPSIEVLADAMDDILFKISLIAVEKKCDISSISNPAFDTRKPIFSDREEMLNLIRLFVSLERKCAKNRQAAGIKKAKAGGVKFGRKVKPIPDYFAEAYEGWKDGKMSAREIMKKHALSSSQFYWLVKKYQKNKGGE